MNREPLDSPVWGEQVAFGASGEEVASLLGDLVSMPPSEWTSRRAGLAFAELGRCLVVGRESAQIVDLVSPWLLWCWYTRQPVDWALALQLLGEIWLARIATQGEVRVDELALAQEIGRDIPDTVPPYAAELACACSVLREISPPDQICVLRLVLLGQQYGSCACAEIIDFEFDAQWQVNGSGMVGAPQVPEEAVATLTAVEQHAERWAAPGLRQYSKIYSKVLCSCCSREMLFRELLLQGYR